LTNRKASRSRMAVDFQSTTLERLDFKSRVVQFPYGEVASATCADALAGSNAADAALAAPRSKRIISIKCSVATMHTTALPEISGHC